MFQEINQSPKNTANEVVYNCHDSSGYVRIFNPCVLKTGFQGPRKSGSMGATAPIDFEKSRIAPIDFDKKH